MLIHAQIRGEIYKVTHNITQYDMQYVSHDNDIIMIQTFFDNLFYFKTVIKNDTSD